jgi:hypothetical protein
MQLHQLCNLDYDLRVYYPASPCLITFIDITVLTAEAATIAATAQVLGPLSPGAENRGSPLIAA